MKKKSKTDQSKIRETTRTIRRICQEVKQKEIHDRCDEIHKLEERNKTWKIRNNHKKAKCICKWN